MGQERSYAQEACYNFLSLVGHARKSMDRVGAQCPRCRTRFAAITSIDAGIADYRLDVNGRSTVIELKDADEPSEYMRFSFSNISADQWRWMRGWEIESGGMGWFYILFGDGNANSKSRTRRRVYMMPRSVLAKIRRDLIHLGGVNTLPLDEEAATRNAVKEHKLYAERLLYDYRLEWTDGVFLPHAKHLFWYLYDVSLAEARENNRRRKERGARLLTRWRRSE